MIEQRLDGLLPPRPNPLPHLTENLAANAALIARLTASASRPPFPFPASLPPFINKTLPPTSMPPMLASLPQFPEIRARLLGLQFPHRQESPPQFSPPGFLGNFNFTRDGSDSPIDGKEILMFLSICLFSKNHNLNWGVSCIVMFILFTSLSNQALTSFRIWLQL